MMLGEGDTPVPVNDRVLDVAERRSTTDTAGGRSDRRLPASSRADSMPGFAR